MTLMRPITDLIEERYTMHILMSVFLSKRVAFALDPSIASHRGRLTAAL